MIAKIQIDSKELDAMNRLFEQYWFSIPIALILIIVGCKWFHWNWKRRSDEPVFQYGIFQSWAGAIGLISLGIIVLLHFLMI